MNLFPECPIYSRPRTESVHIPQKDTQHDPPYHQTASRRPAYRALRVHECASSQKRLPNSRPVHDKTSRTFTINAKTALELNPAISGFRDTPGHGQAPEGHDYSRVPKLYGGTLRNHPNRGGHKIAVSNAFRATFWLDMFGEAARRAKCFRKHKCHWDQCGYGGGLNAQKGS